MKCLFLYFNTAPNHIHYKNYSVKEEYRVRSQGSFIHNGIAYLSSIAKSLDFECMLFDISYVKRSTLKQRFLQTCLKFSPDILAITCFTQNWNGIKDLLLNTFDCYPVGRPLIIIGGPHVSVAPESVISFPFIDIIAIGEGETAFYQVLETLKKGGQFDAIPGIWFKDTNVIVKNSNPKLIKDLDDLPLPDWDVFDQSFLTSLNLDFKKKGVGIFNSSRGCLYHCTYCTSSHYQKLYESQKPYFREKSNERILFEISEKRKKYEFSEIIFHDELFIKNTMRLKELAGKYQREVGLPFIAQTTPESLSEETLSMIKDMGNKELRIGIECGNEEFRRNVLKRRISNQMLIDKFKLVKKYGIKITTYNIIGFPFETEEMIKETIELNKILEPDQTYVNIFQPLPGTPLFKLCLDNQLFKTEDHYDLRFGDDNSIIRTEVPNESLKYYKGMFINVL